MKNICIALIFMAVMVPLNPQSSLAETIVESGDPVIDQSLKEINAAAKENLKEFARRIGERPGRSRHRDGQIDVERARPARLEVGA